MKQVNLKHANQITDEDRKLFKLRAELDQIKESVGSSDKELKYWKAVAAQRRQELEVALALRTNRVSTPKITPDRRTGKSETTAIAVASDWHSEETVDPRTINGLNKFNLEIADQRIRTFFQKVVDLTELWRAGTKIDNLVLALIGDFMTGFIHEEYRELNELTPTQTILWVQERLCRGIEFLINHGKFKRIVVPTSHGNHGRTSIKPRFATSAYNSYEWLMYHELAREFKSVKEVEFVISDGDHNIVDVYGRKVRFQHGDRFKYYGGVGGITIPVNKAINEWNKTNPAWLDIFGHWHQSVIMPNWICGGSLIGYNAFALGCKCAYEPPQQTLVMVERDAGRTAVLPIFLEKF